MLATYRQQIIQLHRTATPEPWTWDGMLYGVAPDGAFTALGYAPHRPADSRLIAVYRSAVLRLVEAVDAVERLVVRASADVDVPAAIGIRQILRILDRVGGAGAHFRNGLAELDAMTTPPLWDPGHLVLGMELGDDLGGFPIARPRSGDAALIAASRPAVPRTLALLSVAQSTIALGGLSNGRLQPAAVSALALAIAAYDSHSTNEGVGSGTV